MLFLSLGAICISLRQINFCLIYYCSSFYFKEVLNDFIILVTYVLDLALRAAFRKLLKPRMINKSFSPASRYLRCRERVNLFRYTTN